MALVSLAAPLQAAIAARLAGSDARIQAVSTDRFLRTGTYLATRVLRAAGIRVDFSEQRVDRPHHDGLWRTAARCEKSADRLLSFYEDWARDLLNPPSFADGEIFDLPVNERDQALPGVLEALATGAGLDWLTRADATQQSLTRAQIGEHKRLPSWRRLPAQPHRLQSDPHSQAGRRLARTPSREQ